MLTQQDITNYDKRMKRKNKITKGTLCNTIAIHKPVTLEEWEKVKRKKQQHRTKRGNYWTVQEAYRFNNLPTFLASITPQPADPTDEEVLALAMLNIGRLEPKFRDGMKKYSTPIFQKSGLKEMLPEILDLISYHAVAQLQWSKVHRLLDDLCVERPGLAEDRLVQKMFAILGDKPLAVKKGKKPRRK